MPNTSSKFSFNKIHSFCYCFMTRSATPDHRRIFVTFISVFSLNQRKSLLYQNVTIPKTAFNIILQLLHTILSRHKVKLSFVTHLHRAQRTWPHTTRARAALEWSITWQCDHCRLGGSRGLHVEGALSTACLALFCSLCDCWTWHCSRSKAGVIGWNWWNARHAA